MNYYQVVLFSASVFIAALIGWVRFPRTGPALLPFLICLSLASVNEILSFIRTRMGLATDINNNLYVLLEALLIIWQFQKWGLFTKNKKAFPAVMALVLLAWITENTVLTGTGKLYLYFRIACSFIIVLMSIHINNTLILSYRKKLLTSPVFIICTGFIIYFTYKILIEAFWLYGLAKSREFRINVYLLLTWINLIVNIMYAIALLWTPKKPQHITLY